MLCASWRLSVRGLFRHMRSSPVHLYNNRCYIIFTSKHTHPYSHVTVHKQNHMLLCPHTLHQTSLAAPPDSRSTHHRHTAAHKHATSPLLEGLGLSGPVCCSICLLLYTQR